MCGISGQIRFDGKKVCESLLKSFIASLEHRGRDGAHFLNFKNVGFAHNRLSIIDPSHNADQPMTSIDKRYVITFNGEIFNYKEIRHKLLKKGYQFKTNSDTEVILNLWADKGEKSINFLEGMFAFAIYDKKLEKVWLIRDRCGIKPLYIVKKENSLSFCSEIKGFIHTKLISAELSVKGLKDYLFMQSYIGSKTLFKNIYSVEPGKYYAINIKENKIEKKSYWSINDIKEEQLTYQETLENFETLFYKSVQKWSIADVPISAYLSGGLDSSSVCTVASQFQKIKTFSSIFDRKNYKDESYYSDLVTHHINADHHKISLNIDEVIADHRNFLYLLDMPIAGYSAPYKTLSRHVRKHSKVVLTGHGGDEFFCGYPKYLIAAFLFSLSNNKKQNNFNYNLLPYLQSFENQSRYFMGKAAFKSEQEIINVIFDRAYFLWQYVNPFFKNIEDDYTPDNAIFELHKDLNLSGLRKTLFLDQKFLLSSLLHVEDRTSMSENLESRTPFLDTSLIEFSYKVPEQYFVQSSLKSIIRDSMKNKLPSEVALNKKKSGIMFPIMDVFNKEMKHIVNKDLKYLDQTELFIHSSDHILSLHPENYDRVMWILWSLASWLKSYKIL